MHKEEWCISSCGVRSGLIGGNAKVYIIIPGFLCFVDQGLKHHFESLVPPFHLAIGLGMVWGRLSVFNSKGFKEGLECFGHNRGSLIGDQFPGCTVISNNISSEGLNKLFGSL